MLPRDGSRERLDTSIEAAALLQGVLNASRDWISVAAIDGSLLLINSGGQAAMAIDEPALAEGRDWLSCWDIAHREPAAVALDCAREGKSGSFDGRTPDAKWWDVTVTPIHSAEASPTMLLIIARDITASRDLEIQRLLLANELSHRIKNILAVVQAVAVQSFRGADPELIQAFASRLAALGTAQALLIQTAWQSAALADVVATALSAHVGADRYLLDGPALHIDGKRVLSLALALHELATNARKYGALSNDHGRIHVRWTCDAGLLRFVWTESGGPEVKALGPPGFGTRLTTRNLAAEFNGHIDVQHKLSGIVLTLTAPL